MPKNKKYPNRLGLAGWAIGGRWGLERYLYTLHRITGLGLLSYFLLHILATSSRVFGEGAWDTVIGGLSSTWLGMVGELMVFLAFAFHACNGIRLVIIELGFGVGKPEEPIYPYKSSLNVQRPLMVLVMLAAMVVAVAGVYDFFFLAAH